MTDNKYAEEIRKTGFVLEYKVADLLRKAGWTVISNKYYEDDFEGSVREIDILAYKVSKVQQVDVYTTLLVSCKKNESNAWALLARDINLKDPNTDWWPLHAWSNDKALAFEIAKPSTAKTYHEEAIKFGVKEALSIPTYEVFAFQEMDRVKGAPRNDKNIFSAVTSLMKAQAYELGALSQRKKKPSVYQFNLLSVIDSDLVRLVLKNDDISQEIVNSDHYISRYIIKKRETCSRIRFISYSSLEEKLKDYIQLHKNNCKWFDTELHSFYSDILKDYTRSNILIEEFRSGVWWNIYCAIQCTHDLKSNMDKISVGWNQELDCATVEVFCNESVISRLNTDTALKEKIRATLKKVYRYDGDFVFEIDDIPF